MAQIGKYVCTTKCFHGGKLWRRGNTAFFKKGEYPTDHDGNIRHFEPIGAEEVPEKNKAGPFDPVVKINEKEV